MARNRGHKHTRAGPTFAGARAQLQYFDLTICKIAGPGSARPRQSGCLDNRGNGPRVELAGRNLSHQFARRLARCQRRSVGPRFGHPCERVGGRENAGGRTQFRRAGAAVVAAAIKSFMAAATGDSAAMAGQRARIRSVQ